MICFAVYALFDPRTREMRYVGKTGVSPARRRRCLRLHALRHRPGADTPVYRWLRELDALGLRPDVDTLEAFPTDAEALEAEEWAIGYFRSIGCPLMNERGSGRAQANSAGSNSKRGVALGGGPVVDDLGRRFSSQAAAERFYGLARGQVGRVMRGIQRTTGGRTFTRAAA